MSDSAKQWSPTELRALRKKTIEWFQGHGRDLPWRNTSDRYAIWLSEVMLQQTQVATVIPYYHRFLERFPTVSDLAAADLDEVYQLWAGLGYYRRARQLHAAAKMVSELHHGKFPSEPKDVHALPGIGRYTGNAVLTFADDARLPIVEANTQRLYSRLIRWMSDGTTQESQKVLWDFATQVLPKGAGSGQLNQALMEIGSQLCLPKNPHCLLCPLKKLCPTYAHGEQSLIPSPKKPKVYTDLVETALIIRDPSGRLLMRRCSASERWAGLWDFLRFDTTNCRTQEALRKRIAELFQARFGCGIHLGEQVHQLKHAVTRYRITLNCFEAELDESQGEFSAPEIETLWVSPLQMTGLALNSSAKRLWNWLQKQRET